MVMVERSKTQGGGGFTPPEGTNISPDIHYKKSVSNFEDDDFRISRLVGYVRSLEGTKLGIVVTGLELQFGK